MAEIHICMNILPQEISAMQRNLLNDKIYLELAQPRNHNLESAQDFIAEQREKQISKSTISKIEMSKLVHKYNDEMIYLRGGVKAALEAGIDVPHNEAEAHFLAQSSSPQKHVRFDETDYFECGFESEAAQSTSIPNSNKNERTSQEEEQHSDEINDLTNELARGNTNPSHSNPISSATSTTSITDSIGILTKQAEILNELEFSADSEPEDYQSQQLAETALSPPAVELNDYQKELKETQEVTDEIEEEINQPALENSVISAFQSHSVQKSKSEKDELTLEDFDDECQIEQNFADCITSKATGDQAALHERVEEAQEYRRQDTHKQNRQLEEEKRKHPNPELAEREPAAPNLCSLSAQIDSDEKTKNEILQNIEQKEQRECEPEKRHKISPAKRAVCNAVFDYDGYLNRKALERKNSVYDVDRNSVIRQWAASHQKSNAANYFQETISRKPFKKQQEYVEQIKQQALERKQQRRHNQLMELQQLGLSE